LSASIVNLLMIRKKMVEIEEVLDVGSVSCPVCREEVDEPYNGALVHSWCYETYRRIFRETSKERKVFDLR